MYMFVGTTGNTGWRKPATEPRMFRNIRPMNQDQIFKNICQAVGTGVYVDHDYPGSQSVMATKLLENCDSCYDMRLTSLA